MTRKERTDAEQCREADRRALLESAAIEYPPSWLLMTFSLDTTRTSKLTLNRLLPWKPTDLA